MPSFYTTRGAYRDAAVLAADRAETAETAAKTAASNAAVSETTAAASATASEDAKVAAEVAQVAAAVSADAALISETNAAASAVAAANTVSEAPFDEAVEGTLNVAGDTLRVYLANPTANGQIWVSWYVNSDGATSENYRFDLADINNVVASWDYSQFDYTTGVVTSYTSVPTITIGAAKTNTQGMFVLNSGVGPAGNKIILEGWCSNADGSGGRRIFAETTLAALLGSVRVKTYASAGNLAVASKIRVLYAKPAGV